MNKMHEVNEPQQHGYWQIFVYNNGKQTPARGWQVADKDQARERYEEEIKQAMRTQPDRSWRVQLIWCVVTETVWEQDGTMY